MATLKLEAGTIQTLVAAGGALAAAAREVSAEFDNSLAAYLFMVGEFELVCTYGTAPINGSIVSLYLVAALDGTNYPDGSASVAPAANLKVAEFVVRNVNTSQRLYSRGLNRGGVPLPAAKLKAIVQNDANQQISANWTLKLLGYRYQSV